MADSDRINALSGGAPLPQADSQTIARRLLGPMADRYGDVLGTRDRTAQDFARDFTVNFIAKDPGKADELKMRVVQGYREELRREEDQRIQAEQAARQQMSGFFSMLENGRSVPKDLRQDFFKENLPKIGVDPTSPLFMKVLSNYEKFGDIYDALGDPEVQRLADEDPLSAVEQLIAMGHDGSSALQVAKSIAEMKRYRAETQKMLSQAHRRADKVGTDPNARARASFITRMLSQQRKGIGGKTRPITPAEVDEIEAMANRFFPAAGAAPAGIAQPGPAPEPAGIPSAPEVPVPGPGTSVTTTPTTPSAETTTPTTTGGSAAAGIAQTAPTPAPAASPRSLTGTVTRLE